MTVNLSSSLCLFVSIFVSFFLSALKIKVESDIRYPALSIY